MNYRHAFHAGGIADVFKHIVLIAAVKRLLAKPKPLLLLDTHAGAGLYSLKGPEAARSPEHQEGISRLQAAKPLDAALQEYLARITAATRADRALYPGSPLILAGLKRETDRLIVCELHPDDAVQLRQAMAGAGVQVHNRNGYEALPAFLPPPERRAFALIDPPFEAGDEFEHAADAIMRSLRKFPALSVAFWYPVKERSRQWQFEDALLAGTGADILEVELLTRPVDGLALAGSGMLLINPPYPIDETLQAPLAALQQILAPHGSHSIRWLRQE